MLKSKFIIKNIETGGYFIRWDYAKDKKGNWIQRPPVHPGHYYGNPLVKVPFFSKDELPKLYNSTGGARKVISEFVGQSYAKHQKMNTAQQVLYGSKDLTKYQIVEVELKIKEK